MPGHDVNRTKLIDPECTAIPIPGVVIAGVDRDRAVDRSF
jgi:hypothetical protein